MLLEYRPLGTITPPHIPFLPSNSTALELVLWSFASHFTQYDWSSYWLHYTLQISIDPLTHLEEGSTQPYTWKWFQLIPIPLWQGIGGGGGRRQQEHFSGVMCTMCNEQQKGHLTHFCQNEFIYFKHLILPSPHWCMAWQCTERVHYHKWRLSFLPTTSADHRSVGMPEEQADSEMECGRSNHPFYHRKITSITFSVIGAFITVQ